MIGLIQNTLASQPLDWEERQEEPLGHDLLNGLVGYWPLDDSRDSNASTSWRELHSGLVLGPGTNNPQNAQGVYGCQASQFDAASSRFLIRASEAALQTGDIDYTLFGWARLADKGAAYCPITKYDTGLVGQLEYYSDYSLATDRFRFIVSGDGLTQTIVTANNLGSPSATTWYFLVMWHDATANTINIQVNNGTADSAAHTTGSFAGTSAFRIGAAGTLGRFWNGQLGGWGFTKRVLTAEERTYLYNGGIGRNYPFV